MQSTDECPCGTGEPYGRCCLPLHLGEREADSAEQLMRSRYSAIALEQHDYVWRTWHPSTRPEKLVPSSGVQWLGLEVVATVAGGRDDSTGEVEFRAHYRAALTSEGQRSGTLHERSRFAVRARRWMYVDGDVFG